MTNRRDFLKDSAKIAAVAAVSSTTNAFAGTAAAEEKKGEAPAAGEGTSVAEELQALEAPQEPQPQPSGDAVDMRIHRKGRHSEREHHYDRGSFQPDSLKRRQPCLCLIGRFFFEFVMQIIEHSSACCLWFPEFLFHFITATIFPQ